MQELSFGVGDWARERTTELAEQFRSVDTKPLADLSRDDLEWLDGKAKGTMMLLRAHLSYCVRQAVPGHPLSLAEDGATIDLRDVRIEIDQVIAEISDARAQIRWALQNEPAPSIIAPEPETVHLATPAEDKILELEKKRRDGAISEAEFATALRAVMLRAKS